jgi:uncharacterized protein YebE (UPF0316 family)
VDLNQIFGRELTVWLVIPLLIFIARIMDVSIGTLRVISIAKGMKMLAPVLGFFEIIIWLLAFGAILRNLNNWQNFIAFACGFAVGNYVGMLIENKLALGTASLRIITGRDATELENILREKGYGLTSIDAEGKSGPVKVLYMLVSRSELPGIIKTVNQYNPHAFYSIEDVRFVNEGIFPPRKRSFRTLDLKLRRLTAKIK